MTGNQQTELLSPPREVDVIAIERELTQLWKDAAEGNGESSSRPVTRACALNFIVVTGDEGDLEVLGALAGDVTLEHPARIFLIAANRRRGTPDLDAWISARCSLPVPGGRQVCCEQINLLASGSEAIKIPSIVTSLLVPDVPGVLLWKARVDVRDHILQSLAHVVERVLVDTSEDPSPETGLLAWREFMRNRALHVMYGDLAWTHLTAWRSVVAGSFNPPDMRKLLSLISGVTVTYSSTVAPQHSGLSQSLLFVAWLASKLSWSILRPFERDAIGRYSAKLRLGEQAINIQIVPAPPRTHHPGAIEEIVLQAGDRALSFQSTEHQHCIRFSFRNPDTTTDHMLTSMSDKSEAELIAEELEVVKRDQGYERVMNTLAGLLHRVTPENNIRRFASADDLQRGAAEMIVRILDEAIAFLGVASLSLSGGSTPKAIYELLARGSFRSSVEWSKVHVFWGDERCVPPSHPESNYRMARESLLDTVRIPQSNIHRIPAEKTPGQAAELYERELKSFFGSSSLPRFDLMLLGMGEDGHTASLFPGTSALDEDARLVASVFVPKLKVHRISLTYPVINNSESILILVSGSGKSAILRDVIAGHPDHYPVQRVDPTHGSLQWLVDDDAASKLNT